MLNLLIAAAFTFTATSTGLEKGAPAEFYWVDKNSDRDYEALFILDGMTQSEFRQAIEKAGLKKGKSVDVAKCFLWPMGCPVTITPAYTNFVDVTLPTGYKSAPVIYTGGTDGSAAFAFYSLNESPFLFNGIYPQGDVYNAYKVKKTMKKGEKVTFTVSWDEKQYPRSHSFTVGSTNVADVIKTLRQESSKGELDVQIALDGALTVKQATPIAQALNLLDTVDIKMNGVPPGKIFFKAFLPQISWLTRKDRLVQPFELTIGATPDKDKLIFIEEDWSVEGDDPKLTLKEISFADALKKDKTNTCFIFVTPETTVERIEKVMSRLKCSYVTTWYVFPQQ